MTILGGKKALILGLANERSIAWGIAQEFKNAGAKLAFTYVNEAIEKRVIPLAQEVNADWTHPMDVTVDSHYADLVSKVKKEWGTFDILVHSLAFAEREDLSEPFSKTSRAGFLKACDISAYSLVGLAHHLSPLMPEGSSIMAMTYHGSTKVIHNYNVMGVAKAALEASARYLAYEFGEKNIRVNCISSGPIKTLSASGINGFREGLKLAHEKAPLKKNISIQDVGQTAVYLASPLSNTVTGQIIYVDAGLSIMGI